MTLGEFRKLTKDQSDETLMLTPRLSYGLQRALVRYANVTEEQDEVFVHSSYKHTNMFQKALVIE